ncbi:MAG: DUF2207 domain-containing protein [bacterium]|nr:DUF2207 domain-containing protein [bacterium]
MRKLLFLIITISGLLFAHLSAVAAGGEQITNFNSQIVVSKENIATITETINYDFAGNYRHGIKRYLPISTKISGTNQSYYYNFKFVEASIDNGQVRSDQSQSGNWEIIRLGDPDKTITDQHIYKITYQIWPVATKDNGGDYINWNITGNQWEIPIDKATGSVTFEPDVQILNSRCYTGAAGSTQQDCLVTSSTNSLQISANSSINPGQGLTLNSLITQNSFTNYLAPSNAPPIDWKKYIGFVIGGLAVLIGMIWRFFSWMADKRKLANQTIIAQYEPPDDLSPAEMGLLNDNRANMTEITATLIDLAVRGYIKIEQIQAKSTFKKAQYRLHLLKSYSDVRDFEKTLLDMVFLTSENEDGHKVINLKDIKRDDAAVAIQTVQNSLKDSLQDKGYYAKPPKKKYTGKLWIGFIVIVVVGYVLIKVSTAFSGSLFGWVFALIGVIIGTALTKRTRYSDRGYKEWALVAGFKLFLSVTEKDRLKFSDAPQKNPKLFNKFLPYAIALGVERDWARQFEGMDLKKSSDWYYSPYGSYTPLIIASSLSSDFSSSVSSSFTPSSSSGGYSSGGFSGGGGGGGGGGSW